MSFISNYLINYNKNCKDAMRQIDNVEVKILFIVDDNNKLLATLTDGDIRRYIVSGGNLEDQIINAGNKNPKSASSVQEALVLYQKEALIAIPIIRFGIIIDIYFGGSEKRIYKQIKKMNVDNLIEKLLSVRGNKPGKQVDLKEEEIKFLIDKSLPIIKEQKMLVELEAPLHVCGDIHGQYYDLLRIFDHCGYPGEFNYLFLGDYVDRGKQSLETVCLLLCYKIKYPEKYFSLL